MTALNRAGHESSLLSAGTNAVLHQNIGNRRPQLGGNGRKITSVKSKNKGENTHACTLLLIIL